MALLLGMLAAMSILSIPVQARTNSPAENQFAANPTKKPHNTKKPKLTATPVRSTPVKPPTSFPTSGGINTLVSPPTQTAPPTSTVGTTTLVFFETSSAATALKQSTQTAKATQTLGSAYLASTSLALSRTPTPTSLNAPTATQTFTPNPTELTASATAPTETPTRRVIQLIGSPTATSIPNLAGSIPSAPSRRGPAVFWIIGIGLIILLVLFFLFTREWKKG